MALDSTTDHIGIKREVYDGGTYFIDYYNTDDSSSPHDAKVEYIKIIEPISITDTYPGVPIGVASGSVEYIGGDVTDLEWTLDNWTTSTAFTDETWSSGLSLSEGEHTLKVRNATTTTIATETTFEIRAYFVGNERWRVIFNDETTGDLWYTVISQRGYTGSSTDICSHPDNPVVIEMAGDDDDIFTPIKPTRCIINIAVDDSFNMRDVANGDEGEFFVEVTNSTTVEVVWRGWVIQDYYSEPYTRTNYYTSIVAIDALTRLKDIPFASRTGVQFNDNCYRFTALFKKALQALGYSADHFDSRFYCPLYPNGQSIATAPTLYYLHIDTSAMYLNGEQPSWWDVLSYVLRDLKLRLTQRYNWEFIYIQRYVSSVTHHTTSNLTGFSTSSRDYKVNAGGIDTYDVAYVNQDHIIEWRPAVKDITVNWTPQTTVDVSPPTAFSIDSYNPAGGLTPLYWGECGSNLNGLAGPYVQRMSDKYSVWLGRYPASTPDNGSNYYKSEPYALDIDGTKTGRLIVTIEYEYYNTSPGSITSMPLHVSVLAAGNYMNSSYGWTDLVIAGGGSDSDVSDIAIAVQTTDFETNETLKTGLSVTFATDDIEWDAQQNPTAQIRIYSPHTTTSDIDLFVTSCRVQFAESDTATCDVSETLTETNSNAKPSELIHTMKFGYSAEAQAVHAAPSQFFDSDREPIPTWNQTGHTGDFALSEILLESIQEEYRLSRQIIDGSFHGDVSNTDFLVIDSSSHIQESYSYNVLKRIAKIRMIKLATTLAWPT